MKKSSLTEGPIIKSLMALSIPIVLANILQTTYQLTDTFWVGRLGTVAVAAVSISFPIIFLLIALGRGLTIAGTILVAQYKGKKDSKAVNHIAGQTLLISSLAAIILSFVGYFSASFFLHLMKASPDVLISAIAYLKISFIGVIFMFIYMVFQSLMRGVGDVKTPMYIVLGSVLLNLLLDPLFIFGYGFIPALGVKGAAVATIGTQSLAALIGVILLFRGKDQIQLRVSHLKPDWPLIKTMFKLGLPASLEQSARAVAMAFMAFLVTGFGTITLAAYGIGSRILGFIIIPARGLSMATSTLTGQNIGAGKVDRAEKITKVSALIGFLTLTFVGALSFTFAKPLAALFIPGSPETIQMSAAFIKIMAWTFGFIGAQMALNGLFRGSGNTMIAMTLSIVSLWGLRFPMAYLLSRFTSLAATGIWVAFPITNVVMAIIAFLWFAKGTWRRKHLIEKTKLTLEAEKEISSHED